MKKISKTMTVCLMLLAMGVTTTSCEEGGVIDNLINILLGNTLYNYQGTYTMQLFYEPNEKGEFSQQSDVATYKNTTVQLKTTNAAAGTTTNASITLPGTEFIQGVTMSDVQLANLSVADGKLDLTNNTSGTGTLTINGESAELTNVYIEGIVTTEELKINLMSLYFGNVAVNLTFKDGKAVVTNK